MLRERNLGENLQGPRRKMEMPQVIIEERVASKIMHDSSKTAYKILTRCDKIKNSLIFDFQKSHTSNKSR